MLDACWVSNPPFASDKLKDRSLPHSTGKVVCDDDVLLSKVQFGHRIRLLNQIKLCQKEKDISKVQRIHGDVVKHNLIAEDAYVANSLITAYAKCGALEEAREIFEHLLVRDVVSWNALICGYAQNRLGHEALQCFGRMRDEGFSPDPVTYASVLKSCGIVKSLEIGEYIYAEVRKQGLLEKDVVLGTALTDMYAKCGALDKARKVFEELPERNVVTWNALIGGYSHNGLGHEALECFRQMKDTGLCPNTVTYICILKACGIEGSLDIGEDIYAEVRNKGFLEKDMILSNALVDMFCKCGELQKAQKVFDELPEKNIVSWSTLIAGYAQNQLGDECLKCFRRMKAAGFYPNSITYISVLKACGFMRCLEIGENIHVEIKCQGLLEKDVMLGTALVDMYSRCGAIVKAEEVFEELPERTVVSWSVLIAGYTQVGLGDKALKCFMQMKDAGVCPNALTYVSVLKACAILRSLEAGKDICLEVTKQGLLEKDVMVGNALVDMYCKCGALEKAQELFERLPMRDVVSWNALISGYAQNGFGDESLKCFKQMKGAGVFPSAVTYVSILKACGMVGCLEIGEDIVSEIREQGLLEKDVLIGNALVGMYSKCGMLTKAQEVFNQLEERDVVAWSALIAGYAQNGLGDEALICFREMKDRGVSPNSVTYMSVLRACGIVGSLEIGEDIYAEVRKQDLLEKDVLLGNAVLDMYCKCGTLEKAQEVFEQLPVWDIVTWNALITGYTQNGLGDEALKCFKQMKDKNVCPDEVTYVCILKACGIVGSLEIGMDINAEVRNNGLLEKYFVLGNALVEMYSKCGELKKAQAVFEGIPIRDVVAWNAVIAGYGQFGQAYMVLDLYNRMKTEDVMPDIVTFIVLLNACGHAGLVKEGEKLFDEMRAKYYLIPTQEHYTCMIDLFGRAGCFDKLNVFLDTAPYSENLPLLRSILGACRKWSNVKLGRWAFEQSVELDKKCAATYVSMGNIYMHELC